MSGVNNLKNSIQSMRKKEKEEKLLKQEKYGKQLLTLKLKLELPICSIKIHAIENLINKI